MSDTAFYKARREAELPAFRKVLEAMPRERFDYRPHERSPAARDIAWTLTVETKACCAFVDEGRVDWQHVDPPGLDDEAWSKPVGLYVNGKLMRERPLGEFLWFMFFDAIHHRGQLSTYIRPMGGKVPAIYGPSGDDPGQ